MLRTGHCLTHADMCTRTTLKSPSELILILLSAYEKRSALVSRWFIEARNLHGYSVNVLERLRGFLI